MKRTRLRPMSAKRRRDLALRRKVVAEVRDRDGGCRAAVLLPEVGCSGPLDVHEPESGALRGDAWLDPDRCVLLCRAHHEHVHDHPTHAYELGLLVRGGR